MRLQVRRPSTTDNRRITRSRLYSGLNFQSTRHSLVVLIFHDASFHVGLYLEAASRRLAVICATISGSATVSTGLHVRFDLQGASRRLVMVARYSASFHIRFDFQVFPFYEIGVNCQAIARHHLGRRAGQLSRSF